jgi:hypothetical protein
MKASRLLVLFGLFTGLIGSASIASAQVAFTGSYLQTFDSMGTAGTSLLSAWSAYSMAGSHDMFTPSDDTITKGVLPTAV